VSEAPGIDEEGLLRAVEGALAPDSARPVRAARLASAGAKADRRVWRVWLSDGRSIKARDFVFAAEAEANSAFLGWIAADPSLGSAFAPNLGRSGPLVLEAWIDGTPVGGDANGAWAEAAGTLLGRLHALARPEIAAAPPRDWADATCECLGAFAARGLLTRAMTEDLVSRVRAEDPGPTPCVLAHRDWCAQNLVVVDGERLCAIDNERFALDTAGLDLGRVWSRWPLSVVGWRRLLAGYRASPAPDPGPLSFWEIVGATWSAWLRVDAGEALRDFSFARLKMIGERSPSLVHTRDG